MSRGAVAIGRAEGYNNSPDFPTANALRELAAKDAINSVALSADGAKLASERLWKK